MVEEYQVESQEEYKPLDAKVKTIYSEVDLSDGVYSNINILDILHISIGLSGIDTLNQTQLDVDINSTQMTYVMEHDKHGVSNILVLYQHRTRAYLKYSTAKYRAFLFLLTACSLAQKCQSFIIQLVTLIILILKSQAYSHLT